MKLFIVSLTLAVVLSACGGGAGTTEAQTPEVVSTPAPTSVNAVETSPVASTGAGVQSTEVSPLKAEVIAPIVTSVAGTQHIISYGQSLSLGERSVISYPSNTNIPSDYQDVGLMFGDGIRSLGFTSSLVAFAETTSPMDYLTWVTSTTGETPLYGILLQLKGLSGKRIGSAAGRGGTPIADLSKGSEPYARLLRQVQSGKAGSGSSYSVPAITWMHGEADPFNTNYAAQFSQLVSDLDTDVRAITGQTQPVQFHVCLTSYAVPSAAQQAVAGSNPNVHIACDSSNYAKADGVHLLASGSRDAGLALGASILKYLK